MKKGQGVKHQDDTIVNSRSESFRSSGGSHLTKSLMETTIPKIKENIYIKSKCSTTQNSLYARSLTTDNSPIAQSVLGRSRRALGGIIAECVPMHVAETAQQGKSTKKGAHFI